MMTKDANLLLLAFLPLFCFVVGKPDKDAKNAKVANHPRLAPLAGLERLLVAILSKVAP